MQEPRIHPETHATFTVLDVVLVFAKHKRLVLGLPLLAGLVAFTVALMLPNEYTAVARILPPQQEQSSAAAMLGALTGAGVTATAVGQVLGVRNPNDLYAGILKGHTVADRVIEKLSLRQVYDAHSAVAARRALARATSITAGKDGLISISVEDTDPQRAADIVNAYVDELDRLLQGLALTEAAQRRLFFEKQLATAHEKLSEAESALRRAIETKGITAVGAQSRALFEAGEQLRAQIAVKEIQLDAMRAFATPSNPDAVRLRHEIASMKAELHKLEGGRGDPASTDSPSGLENVQKLREVKFLESVVEFLTKQYEVAKIDEAKDAVLIQVVDKAVRPDQRSKPNRALIVVVAVLAFGVVGVVSAFVCEAASDIRRDPTNKRRLDELRKYVRLRAKA